VHALRESPTRSDRAESFSRLADAALAYERHCFDPVQRNWPDYRNLAADKTEPDFMAAWCHGAPGVAMGRLMTAGREISDETQLEIAIAIDTTLAQPCMGNHSLCHGELGNILIASRAQDMFWREDWRRKINLRLRRVVDDLIRNGPRCGVPNGEYTPGLLTGVAGIGYGLLQLAQPHLVPNVLALEQMPTSRLSFNLPKRSSTLREYPITLPTMPSLVSAPAT